MATRLSDGARIKIGTCETMYYCRWDQRMEISYPYFSKNCLWRIPALEEDGIKPGDFEFGALVGKYGPLFSTRLTNISQELLDSLAEDSGIVQAQVDALGIIINVQCTHGARLPKDSEELTPFWNGRYTALHLVALKNTEDDLQVTVQCSACRHMWSFTFEQIYHNIASLPMLLRIWYQVSEYRIQLNKEPARIEEWQYSFNGSTKEEPEKDIEFNLRCSVWFEDAFYYALIEEYRNGTLYKRDTIYTAPYDEFVHKVCEAMHLSWELEKDPLPDAYRHLKHLDIEEDVLDHIKGIVQGYLSDVEDTSDTERITKLCHFCGMTPDEMGFNF